MNLYEMGMPKRIISGEGSENKIKEILIDEKVNNILLLIDSGVYGTGITKNIEESLKEFNIHLLTELPLEAEYKEVLQIYEEVKDKNIEFIIAIGGGSTLDLAKIVSVLFTNESYRNNMLDPKLIVKAGLPKLFVPTSAGTGAEVTQNAIVVVPEDELKVGIVSRFLIPEFVILEPKLTLGLPSSITASTGLDALCHSIECYISKKKNPFSDMFALKSIGLISENLINVYKDGSDIKGRENMLLAALYGGFSIGSSSTVAIHALSYPLGGKYRIPHGVSNAILLPHIIEYNMSCCIEEYNDIANAMGLGNSSNSKEEKAQLVVDEMFRYIDILNIPKSLKEYNITDTDLDGLVDAASKVTRLLNNNPKEMTKEDIKQIYINLM